MQKINLRQPHILVAPLDWGLGHATRCIPIIRALQANGCQVYIAAEKATQSLLQHEFDQAIFLPLRGYRIRYSRNRHFLPLVLLVQLPGLLLRIYREHRWLKLVVKKYRIDGVISDNRFGLSHATLPTVYITHQLLIKAGYRSLEWLLQQIHTRFIQQFTHCWVPDFEGQPNAAGDLSHTGTINSNVLYIGCLSRFNQMAHVPAVAKPINLLVLISGPEPQRTIFEGLILAQLGNYSGYVVLVRGLPDAGKGDAELVQLQSQFSAVTIYNHLPADELGVQMAQAAMVLCRSGYTTIMDLIQLGKKAILVPTPGQTEQEYLANYLMGQQLFFSVKQDQFDLKNALESAREFSFSMPVLDMNLYKKAVANFVATL